MKRLISRSKMTSHNLENTSKFLRPFRKFALYLWHLRMRVPARYVVHIVILIFGGLVAFRNVTSTNLESAFKSSEQLGRYFTVGQEEIVEGIETLPVAQVDEEGETILSAGIDLPALAVNSGGLEQLALVSKTEKIAITAETAIAKPSISQTKKGERPRRDVLSYVVQPGDTLSTIAEEYGLKLRTLLWANDLTDSSTIKPDARILVMPFDGVLHVVEEGETLDAIVSKYKASLEKTMSANNLVNEDAIKDGQRLLIPDGVEPAPPPPPAPEPIQVAAASSGGSVFGAQTQSSGDTSSQGSMVWPATCRNITQYFQWGHNGVDIACALGSNIFAADGGVVRSVGWDGGYGNAIVICHDYGLCTRYAHLTSGGAYVSPGQRVSQGQVIGAMGSTGYSTGPHIHFEVLAGTGYSGFENPLNRL